MKISKLRLRQIIKEELAVLDEGDLYGGDSPHETLADVKNDPNMHQSSEVPPEVALMEDLWDVVRGFYSLGRSDIALKLQKIAEIADQGHERLLPRGEGTPGLELPAALSKSAWDLKNKLGIGKP